MNTDMTEQNRLEIELFKSAMEGILTEERFNETLDLLLPMLPDIPEATATLKLIGGREWLERRHKRIKASQAA